MLLNLLFVFILRAAHILISTTWKSTWHKRRFSGLRRYILLSLLICDLYIFDVNEKFSKKFCNILNVNCLQICVSIKVFQNVIL